MSLLLQALKNTEQSERENNALQPAPADGLQLAETAETAPAVADPAPPAISLPESPAAPQDVIRRESIAPSLSVTAGCAVKTRNDAKQFLATKQVKPQRKLALLGALLIAIAVAGAGAAYYFRKAALQPATIPASGMGHPAMPLPATPPLPQAQTAQSFEPDLATPPQTPPKPIIAEAVRAGSKPPSPKNSAGKRILPAKSGKVLAATSLPMEGMDAASASAISPDSGIKIYRVTGEAELEALLSRAYKAYMAGDIDKAKTDYLKALKQAPNSHDALLGLAAIAANRGQTQKAIAQYRRVLHLYPQDVAAQAGLIVQGGDSDPVANESSLKTLLAQNPDIGFLHFALGNLYAQQSRWPEAQEAFYNAFHTTSDNADYAFNLAISLDHLDQLKPARAYYQRALALTAGQRGGFDNEQLKKRIEELQSREQLGEG